MIAIKKPRATHIQLMEIQVNRSGQSDQIKSTVAYVDQASGSMYGSFSPPPELMMTKEVAEAASAFYDAVEKRAAAILFTETHEQEQEEDDGPTGLVDPTEECSQI